MSQRGLKLVPEDVWSRANYVLAVKMLDPQFKGQVKNELISRDGVKLVAQMVRDPFELWLSQHVDEGKRIAELVIRQAMARTRAAQKVEREKEQKKQSWISTILATGEATATSAVSAGDFSCMNAPVAFCPVTVPRTHGSVTVTITCEKKFPRTHHMVFDCLCTNQDGQKVISGEHSRLVVSTVSSAPRNAGSRPRISPAHRRCGAPRSGRLPTVRSTPLRLTKPVLPALAA